MNKITHYCLLSFILILLGINLNAQNLRPKGLIFDNNQYEAAPKLGVGFNFSAKLLPAVSLKKYCPTPGNQRDVSSCVGWATGYGAYTVSYCKQNNITDQAKKDSIAFNAMYIYNNILPSTADCNSGTRIPDALNFMTLNGDCRYTSFVTLNCKEIPGERVNREAANYKIKDYGTIFNITSSNDEKINQTMLSLSQGKPVIIGMNLTASFENLHQKRWVVTDKEVHIGGHAMVVIGYNNDEKTFEIMNSWDTTWGDRGFFEISFDDFADLVYYGMQMNLSGGDVEKNIAGKFHFMKYTGIDNSGAAEFTEVKPSFSDGTYTVSAPANSYFRLQADDMTKDCYVYVFSLKPDGSAEILFPYNPVIKNQSGNNNPFRTDLGWSVKELPRVMAKDAQLTIPEGENKAMQADQRGEDYLCILYTAQPLINIKEDVEKVKSSTAQNFYDRLKDVFGDDLVQNSSVTYDPNLMSVNASLSNNYIVPIVLKATVN